MEGSVSDPGAANNPTSKSKDRLRDLLSWVMVDPIKKAVGTGIVALVIAGGVGALALVDSQIKKYVANAILDELKKHDGEVATAVRATVTSDLLKDNGELDKAFKEKLGKLRKSEAGVVNVGSFSLTPTNRSYTMAIYYPAKYTGKIFYQIKGNIVPDCRYVVLATPSGKAIKLAPDSFINLEHYFGAANEQAQFAGILERPRESNALQNNIKAITFQLDGPGLVASPVSSGFGRKPCEPMKDDELTSIVEISYVSLVAPFIQMGSEDQGK